MKIGVISDTHIPRTAKDIPSVIYSEFKNVDLIVHAGDFVEIDFLNRLRDLKETIAVYGNLDSNEVVDALKAKEIIEAGGFRIGLVHGWGPPGGLIERIEQEFKGEKIDSIIFGHSHRAMNETKNGILFFNPGSPTDKIFAPFNSYGVLEVTDKITAKVIKL
ncbi:MAG: hypothetical protein AMJ78_01300 [Omnitrophica WOR_2 bacterium SM23_29]|nr:MAG: hypothetical protein AMJ78_01300 [Omnitrophica WOR_2 bacterium SM23_29]